MIRARIDEAALRVVINAHQARSAQLKISQRLANELDATLVRRRDGTYYLRAGAIHGEVPIGAVEWPNDYNPDAAETAGHQWLSQLADALDAELVYDGQRMEWFLRWPDAEPVLEVPAPAHVSRRSESP